MIGPRRGGPGQFDARLARAEHLLAAGGSACEPLAAHIDVLHHQRRRASAPEVAIIARRLAATAGDHRSADVFPLLDLAALGPLEPEVARAVSALDGARLPTLLRDAGARLSALPAIELHEHAAAWLEDSAAAEPAVEFWFRVAAGPPLELAAATAGSPTPDEWHGSSCPLCGGPAHLSVIAEESGEFLGGSPRSLVCARCASWWSYPRATCPLCGEDDPRQITPFVEPADRLTRIDGCRTCHGYIKTFDLREAGAQNVVPLVDDVATMVLDLWAGEHGFARASLSNAGV